MIALDSNILVYAYRSDSDHHAKAKRALDALFARQRPVAIPWPCAHEFLSVITHRRVYVPPTTPDVALQSLGVLVESPYVRMIGETREHLTVLSRLLASGEVRGPQIHDARIAAICLGHGVEALWTADRDFSYFPELVTHNPLVT